MSLRASAPGGINSSPRKGGANDSTIEMLDLRKVMTTTIPNRSDLLSIVVARLDHEDLQMNVLDILNEYLTYPSGHT